MTIINLPYLLREQYQIPEHLEDRCDMPRLGDSTWNLSYALVVGSNYKGLLLQKEFVDRIRDDLFGGQDPQSPKRSNRDSSGSHAMTLVCFSFFMGAMFVRSHLV